MKEVLVGFFVGAVFTFIKVAPPCPTDYRGILAILGLYGGYILVTVLRSKGVI
jgi:XapX domain-containing protein